MNGIDIDEEGFIIVALVNPLLTKDIHIQCTNLVVSFYFRNIFLYIPILYPPSFYATEIVNPNDELGNKLATVNNTELSKINELKGANNSKKVD